MAYEQVLRNLYTEETGVAHSHSSATLEEDMQDFHRPMDRMQNANLHDWGIARGLEVSGAIYGPEVIIQPGVALNAQGELISLRRSNPDDDEDTGADIATVPPTDSDPDQDNHQRVEAKVPVHLKLKSQAGKTVYVTIQFSVIRRSEDGSTPRVEHVPWIRLQPVSGYKDDENSIILAIVKIDAAGNLAALNADGRRVIGQSLEELRIQRSTHEGDSVQETLSGTIGPGDGGGLKITVPSSGDNVSIAKEGGENFSTLEMRANTVVAKDAAGRDALSLNTAEAAIAIGAKENAGKLSILTSSGETTIQLEGQEAHLTIGGEKKDGDLFIKNGHNVNTFQVNGYEGDIMARDNQNREVMKLDASEAKLSLGSKDNSGKLSISDDYGREAFSVKHEHSKGYYSVVSIGSDPPNEVDYGSQGILEVKTGGGSSTFSAFPGYIHMRDSVYIEGCLRVNSLGKYDTPEDPPIFSVGGDPAKVWINDNANVTIGGEGNSGDLIVKNNQGNESVRLYGDNGNLKLCGQLRDGLNRNIGLTYDQKQDLTDSGFCSLHKHINSGNATGAFVRLLDADSTGSLGGTVITVSINPRRRVFAYIAITSIDPRNIFDRGDAFWAEVYRVDGRDDLARINPYTFGGELGEDGWDSNNRSPFFIGEASSITFRLRSIEDAFVEAIAIVFPEFQGGIS